MGKPECARGRFGLLVPPARAREEHDIAGEGFFWGEGMPEKGKPEESPPPAGLNPAKG